MLGIGLPAVAGIGNVDNRYYVTTEMWAKEPYKKFVHLLGYYEDKSLAWTCTAQYIAPNLILSAGHCTKEGALYGAFDYKSNAIRLKLVKTGWQQTTAKLGDWAVFLIEDSRYYSDSFFDVSAPSQANSAISVLNAGWGWVRIIKDDELESIQKMIADIVDNDADIKPAKFFDVLSARMEAQNMEGLEDKEDRLKASKCKIVFEDCRSLALSYPDDPKIKSVCDNQTSLSKADLFPDVLASTCDSWKGNSGGGYISENNKTLYGVCSWGAYGTREFVDAYNTDYIAASSQFENEIKALKKEYPVKVDDTCETKYPNAPKAFLACCRAGDETRWRGEEQNGTCTCVDQTKQWEYTEGQQNGRCVAKPAKDKCETKHPNASMDRLACCRAGNTTKWTGDEQRGTCTCVDKTKQWEYTYGQENGSCVEKTVTQEPVTVVPISADTNPGTTDVTSGAVPVTTTTTPTTLTTTADGGTTSEVPQVVIDELQQEVNNLDTAVTQQIPQAPNLSAGGLLGFLGTLVEYKVKSDRLEALKKRYDDAKARENSLANRLLGGLTMAATGLGGMELAMGLAEQRADEEAARDMAAYLETFRCSYGNGHSVKAGLEPIELPGGNDGELMNLRNEYVNLAASLKERKESLGMKPGIESEEILDKANMGLYDDENVGITGGAYSSLYRATALNSEEDQAKINADKEKSEKRVKIGGTVAGVGAVGGAVGNSMINGKLGEVFNDGKDTGVIMGTVKEVTNRDKKSR